MCERLEEAECCEGLQRHLGVMDCLQHRVLCCVGVQQCVGDGVYDSVLPGKGTEGIEGAGVFEGVVGSVCCEGVEGEECCGDTRRSSWESLSGVAETSWPWLWLL